MNMNRRFTMMLLAAAVAAIGLTQWAAPASAHPYMLPLYRARCYNWNSAYAQTSYGQPIAMVVPPTANMQTNWDWGVSSSRISRLDHQFGRNFYGFGPFGAWYRPTPLWPSDTNQFGVYNVRGPW
jgi:hypothetical protein